MFYKILQTVATVPSTGERRLVVTELDANVEYTFRITTINDYGEANQLVGCDEAVLVDTTGNQQIMVFKALVNTVQTQFKKVRVVIRCFMLTRSSSCLQKLMKRQKL